MALIRPKFQLLTPHFSTTELVDRSTGQAPSLAALKKLAEFAEMIRHELGDLPMHITSGYRTPEHNAEVGGAKDSQHIHCKAIDFVVRGLTVKQTWRLCRELQKQGAIGGLGRYETWTHCDMGPTRSWDGP